MKQFIEFMDKYFFFIWLAIMIWVVSNLYFRGRLVMKQFGSTDSSKIIFSEKTASGYSNRTWLTKRGGAKKILHVIITENELIIKTFLLFAYITKKYDLLHRIPLKNITNTTIKNGFIYSKLIISFRTKDEENKEIVIMSPSNIKIKELLDKYSKDQAD